MATANSKPVDSAAHPHILSANYKSPTNALFTHSQQLLTPPTSSPADKAAYLGSLRKAAAALQDHINTELTARMEEDKAREAGSNKGTVDEKKEEDNYGEEVVEED